MQFLQTWLNSFTVRSGLRDGLLVGGLLARCLALLRGIKILRDGGGGDSCGLLLRGIVEADLVGLYVLLGGQAALDLVLGDFRRNTENLWERNPSPDSEEPGFEWNIERAYLKIEKVAADLGPLLVAAGDSTGDTLGVYNSIYRAMSTYDVHPAGAAVRYTVGDINDAVWHITTDPQIGGLSAKRCLHLGSLYTAYFLELALGTLVGAQNP